MTERKQVRIFTQTYMEVTLILAAMFVLSQVVGLAITYKYLPQEKQLPFGLQRPQIQPQETFVEIAVAIAVTTALALLVVKIKGVKIWKFWFLLSVFFYTNNFF